MLTLLSPAGLWALSALALPLAIHLWRRPPRLVRLGSLRCLARVTRARVRDFRWEQRLLLAVRLLLLTLLALMLARPHWLPRGLDRPRHWALIDPAAVLSGEPSARLHALQAAGYETHPFTAGGDLWSTLREMDAGLPAGSVLAVFTPGRLSSLRGRRPALTRCRVEWSMTPDREVAPAPANLPPPLTVAIWHDAERAEDARYLSAAIRAVAQAGHRPITVFAGAAPGLVDWAFRLGAPAGSSQAAANLCTDAPAGPVETTPGWLVPARGVPGAEIFAEPTRLWQRVAVPADPSATIFWTDAAGRPLLTRTGSDAHWHWHFYSRFHPDWTDLPRTTAFAAWLRALLSPDTNAALFADPAKDRRLADPAQLAPATTPGAADAVSLPLPRQTPGLQGWCWLFAAICFALERGLSFSRRPEPALAR